MISWLLAIGVIVIALFSFVLLFGAPFLPTLSKRKQDALDLLDLKPGETLVELGSGDGRMLAEAAKRGINGIGYELNPLLVVYSMFATLKYRKYITIKLGNYWHKRLPECQGIYVFLLNPYMAKLHTKIVQEIRSPVKLVSFAFQIPDKKPAKEVEGMFLYKFSAEELAKK